MITCYKCGVELIIGENWLASRANQRQYICTSCRLINKRNYRTMHKTVIKKRRRLYYLTHREAILEHKRLFYQSHKAMLQERARLYRREQGQKTRERDRLYRRTHKEMGRACVERYRARKAGATIKPVDEATIYMRDNYECQYCGSRENLELDHIVPLSKGGAHSEDNLVVACRHCNSSKGSKPLIIWLIRGWPESI